MWFQDEARLGLKPVVRRVWAPVREGVANESVAGVELLEDRLCDRRLHVSARPELVSALTSYHWLPDAA